MKIMKRFLSLLIIASMLFSTGFVLADETNTIVYGVNEMGLINALGIAEYEEADLGRTITRGEFYKIVCLMTGYPETKNSDIIYSDLTNENEYAGYIKTLTKLGMISSFDGKIYPDSPIKSSEAVKLVVNSFTV